MPRFPKWLHPAGAMPNINAHAFIIWQETSEIAVLPLLSFAARLRQPSSLRVLTWIAHSLSPIASVTTISQFGTPTGASAAM